MPIDWFTVAAQALNFLILVWLMKRFLYQPILRTIDEREQRIASQLAAAEKMQADAAEEHETYQLKNQRFDHERHLLLDAARAEAEAQRHQLLEQARHTADQNRARQEESLRREHALLAGEITRRTHQEVLAITRRALGDLADTSLEERLVGVFVRKVRSLDAQARDLLRTAVQKATEPAVVRSAVTLSPEQGETIRQALSESLGSSPPIRFVTDHQLVAGIEFAVHGQKIVWSIAEYLSSLEHHVGQLLQAPASPASP